MSVNYKELKNERQWRSSTGLKECQFRLLAGHFAEAYEQIHGGALSERKGNSSQESVFKTYEEVLILDGTEQRSQRPQDNEVQKEAFSGKKNRTP
jgi:hypothetical protein